MPCFSLFGFVSHFLLTFKNNSNCYRRVLDTIHSTLEVTIHPRAQCMQWLLAHLAYFPHQCGGRTDQALEFEDGSIQLLMSGMLLHAKCHKYSCTSMALLEVMHYNTCVWQSSWTLSGDSWRLLTIAIDVDRLKWLWSGRVEMRWARVWWLNLRWEAETETRIYREREGKRSTSWKCCKQPYRCLNSLYTRISKLLLFLKYQNTAIAANGLRSLRALTFCLFF